MIELVQGDLTRLQVDAIVNAANERFRGGGGVDGAIHRAAGPELLEECKRHPRLPTGEAVLTSGYRLPAKYVIHTVGPIWSGGRSGEPELLERAYESVFQLAEAKADIRTLAFPAISAGAYGFPAEPAARIALGVMRRHQDAFDRVVACLFDERSQQLYQQVLASLRADGGR